MGTCTGTAVNSNSTMYCPGVATLGGVNTGLINSVSIANSSTIWSANYIQSSNKVESNLSDGIRCSVAPGAGYAGIQMLTQGARMWTMSVSPNDSKLLFSDNTGGVIAGTIASGSGELQWNTHLSLQAGSGWKPGGGQWDAVSDIRIKDVKGEYTRGLADLIKLRPVIYTYKGNDCKMRPSNLVEQPSEDGMILLHEKEEPTAPYRNSQHYQAAVDQEEFVGLVAQEVEPVFPTMVRQRPGWINNVPVTDMKTLHTSELIYALVNAVKELSAKVAALEGAR